MEPPVQLFAILLISGLILIGAEIFVPGGIVGSIGVLALLGAVAMGFVAFGQLGWIVAAAVIVLGTIAIILWIKIFPRSRMGRKMTVEHDLSACKAIDVRLEDLLGQKGTAVSDLRPAGYAMLGTRRVDVVTEGGMISKGTPVEVVRVEGVRVVVKPQQSGT
jgi:membrane-bound serine protease (ClpP class)